MSVLCFLNHANSKFVLPGFKTNAFALLSVFKTNSQVVTTLVGYVQGGSFEHGLAGLLSQRRRHS